MKALIVQSVIVLFIDGKIGNKNILLSGVKYVLEKDKKEDSKRY